MMMKTVAERLIAARKRAGLTQEQLGKAAGVGRMTIAQIELGRNKRPRQLEQIAKALDVPTGWLAFGEGFESLTPDVIQAAQQLQQLPEPLRSTIVDMIQANTQATKNNKD